ncbi:MAG: SPOR domain-containing protein [Pyrinomonadaceae bacterium]|nr:SPOR domain-containing protein [Pyrinomonadaceae bacterium]
MKHCPKCGSSYTDDTLVYCLQDGATLQHSSGQVNPLSMISTLRDDARTNEATNEGLNSSSAPTIEIPSSAVPTALYQEARPTAPNSGDARTPPVSASTTQPADTSRVIITTVVITILLLGLGGIGAWWFFRGGGDGRGRERRAAGENSNAALPADSPDAANPSESNTQARGANRPDKGGRWFVILASFQKDELSRANERLEVVRSQGFDARIISSDDYPNFKSGLWLVAIGPITRNQAEELLDKVRPKIKDAYTKSGW